MAIRKKCRASFMEKLDWELSELIEMEPKLMEFNANFEIASRLVWFGPAVKEHIFRALFNEQIFKFLGGRIEKMISPEQRRR